MVGTIAREMLKAGAAVIENAQDMQAWVVQHDAVNFRVGRDSPWTAGCRAKNLGHVAHYSIPPSGNPNHFSPSTPSLLA